MNQPANTRDIMMMEYTNEPAAAGHVQSNQKVSTKYDRRDYLCVYL